MVMIITKLFFWSLKGMRGSSKRKMRRNRGEGSKTNQRTQEEVLIFQGRRVISIH